MPIRPSQRSRYPKDWPNITQAIKNRAEWRCECEGECLGLGHVILVTLNMEAGDGDDRCPNVHGEPSIWSGKQVVLTTAHLDHTPENNDPENLRGYCQACHLNYDRDEHRATRARTKAGMK